MSGAPSKFRVDYVEAALIALLQSTMPAAYATSLNQQGSVNVDIAGLGDKDFDADGQLVLQPPSLRVRFGGAHYNNLRDNQRLSYEAGVPFEVLCFESSLRSKIDERKQTLVLVATVQNQLAGARLALADGTSSGPIAMKSVQLVITDAGPVDQLFAILVEVLGIAQFDGPNARFGS